MLEETLKQKTAKGLFWGGLSNGIQQFLGMLFGIYLARVLNAEDYGLVGMLAIFSGIAGTIINSGFTVALTNKQNATQKDYNAVFWFMFFVGLVCYIMLFFCAPLISDFYKRPELTNLSRVVFLSFFISGCSAVSYTVMFKRLMVKQQAQIDIIAMLLSGLVGITFAMKGFAYWALALQSVTFVCGGALLRFIVSPWKPTLEIDFKPLRGMLSFSSKLFFTNIFQQINGNLLSVLLGRFYNATQLGFYSQGQKWANMSNCLLTGMFGSVSQPVLVLVKDNIERQINVTRKMVRFGAFISFPVMLGLAFIANEFIFVLLGSKWLNSVPFLQLFCISGTVGYLWNIYTNLLIALGKANFYMFGTIIAGLLQILSVALFFHWGIYYMLVAYIVSVFISICVFHYLLNKIFPLRFWWVLKDSCPYLGATLISLFVASIIIPFISNLYILLISKIVITMLVYISIIWYSKSIILRDSIKFICKKY